MQPSGMSMFCIFVTARCLNCSAEEIDKTSLRATVWSYTGSWGERSPPVNAAPLFTVLRSHILRPIREELLSLDAFRQTTFRSSHTKRSRLASEPAAIVTERRWSWPVSSDATFGRPDRVERLYIGA